MSNPATASHFYIYQSLYQLAGKKSLELMGVRSFQQLLSPGHYFGPELYELARTVAGVETMSDADVLLTFLEPEARDICMQMPNPYWFWAVLGQAVVMIDHDDGNKVSRKDVLDAILLLRRNLGYKYDLRQRLADLPVQDGRREHRIASRAAVGLALIQTSVFENDTAIDNPVFFETY